MSGRNGIRYPVWTQPESPLVRRVRLLRIQRTNLTDKIARARKPERIEKLRSYVDEIDLMIVHLQALVDLRREGVSVPVRELALRVWQENKGYGPATPGKEQAK